MVALVPVIAFMTFFGPAIAIAIFDVGKFDLDAADQLGMVCPSARSRSSRTR